MRLKTFSSYPKDLSVFASGCDAKNCFSVFKHEDLFISEVIGDLQNAQNHQLFMRRVQETKEFLLPKADIVAYDLYSAARARAAHSFFPSAALTGVQHHHAHIAAVMADRSCSNPVIGVAFDDGGRGTDDTVWGGEFLITGKKDFLRMGHLSQIALPGGSNALYEPYRLAVALFHRYLGPQMLHEKFGFLTVKEPSHYTLLRQMLETNTDTLISTSCGGLFSAMASLLGLCHIVRDPQEAVVQLEQEAQASGDKAWYPFQIREEKSLYVLDYRGFLKALVSDIHSGDRTCIIARRFHNTVSEMIVAMCERLRMASGLATVALAGTMFHNRLLYERTLVSLKERKFTVLETGIPLNDASICLGQTFVALNRHLDGLKLLESNEKTENKRTSQPEQRGGD